jgi:nucleotide-binding universal stress UspA family protein
MAATATRNHAAQFPAAVKNVLVVVCGLQDARATARILAGMHAREAIRIHLLAVETPPSGYARFFLRDVDYRKVQEAEGLEKLAPLRGELEAAGIPYRFHVEIGPWLATISRFSREIGCARIVVGTNPGHAFRDLLLWHDCWRIRSHLRRAGSDCPVVRREERARSLEAALPHRAPGPH